MINMAQWQSLKGSAIWRKQAGDIDGAIADILKAIGLTKAMPNLSEETELSLNFLAADLYLAKNAIALAEESIREAIELARSSQSAYLANHLLVLAEIQCRNGEHREALASAEEARYLFQQQNHPHGVSHVAEDIKRILSMLGDRREEGYRERI